jgi:hypothetical protein
MLRMCVYMHSHFIENHPIRILEDEPLISEGVLSQLTPSTIAPHAMDPSKASILQGAGVAKPYSSTVPTGRTSDIKCHRCHGIGHFQ